jgi:hypothetical protein
LVPEPVWTLWRREFLPLPGLELRHLGRLASQSLFIFLCLSTDFIGARALHHSIWRQTCIEQRPVILGKLAAIAFTKLYVLLDNSYPEIS